MKTDTSSVAAYTLVLAALLGLTALTTAVAYVDLGLLNAPVALLIASGKAALVILYFMHVRHAGRLTWIYATAGFLWLFLLVGGTWNDFVTRNW